MEFGSSPQPQGSPDIDDATRLEASTRQRVILPSHDSVAPEDLSDEQIITQHLVQPAVANASNDTEYLDGDQADNIAADKSYHIRLLVSLSVIVLLAAILIFVYILFM